MRTTPAPIETDELAGGDQLPRQVPRGRPSSKERRASSPSASAKWPAAAARSDARRAKPGGCGMGAPSADQARNTTGWARAPNCDFRTCAARRGRPNVPFLMSRPRVTANPTGAGRVPLRFHGGGRYRIRAPAVDYYFYYGPRTKQIFESAARRQRRFRDVACDHGHGPELGRAAGGAAAHRSRRDVGGRSSRPSISRPTTGAGGTAAARAATRLAGGAKFAGSRGAAAVSASSSRSFL